MRKDHADDIEHRERLIASTQVQIDRICRMDDGLYDDKLAGDITPEKYDEKHQQFTSQKAELEDRLFKLDSSLGQRLEQRLVILELSQRAAELYPKKAPEQKRIILSKLFANLTIKEGSLSVTYTNFARAIAERSDKTRKLLGGQICR